MKYAHRSFLLLPVLLIAVALPSLADSAQTAPAPKPEATHAPTSGASPQTVHLLKKAKTQIGAGQFDAALATLQLGLEGAPADVELLRTKGAIERRLGNNAAARSTYEALLAAAPDDALASPILALLLADAATQAPPEEAFNLLARAHTLSEAAPDITATYCLAAARAKQPEAVATTYALLDDARRNETAYMTAAALAYRELLRFEEAAALYSALLTLSPKDASIAESYVDTLTRGAPATSAARLAAAYAQHPACVPLLRVYSEWCMQHGATWRGLSLLTQLLALTPDNAELVGRRAALLADLGCATLAASLIAPLGDSIDATVREGVQFRLNESRALWEKIDVALGTINGPTGLLTLAYGDITDDAAPTSTGVRQRQLIEQIEYLRGHNFRFVSVQDLAADMRGKQPLPERAVLLVFTGAYASFAERALPVLAQYNCPALLAIPTAAIENRSPAPASPPLLTWSELKAISANRLITLASMTHALGGHVQSNPQGRLTLCATSRIYTSTTGRYETSDEYRARIDADLRQAQRLINSRAGRMTDILVWPEGAFTGAALDIARNLDFGIMFATRRPYMPVAPDLRPAMTPAGAVTLAAFARDVWQWGQPPRPAEHPTLAMPMELDPLIGDTPEETRAQVEKAVERAVNAGVDTVYLAGCADEDGDGAAESAFFNNRVLPVKADILDYTASLLQYRGIRVLIHMPTLGIRPPGVEPDKRLFVMQYRWGRVAPDPHNLRLSPFHPESVRLIHELHEDLAAYVHCDGVLFGRDAHLANTEDVGPSATKHFIDQAGIHERNPEMLNKEQRLRRDDLKQAALDNLLLDLRRTIAVWNPSAEMARAIAAPVVMTPNARAEYAQNYQSTLAQFDTVYVDVDPESHDSGPPQAWMGALVEAVKATPGGLDRTVFVVELQPRGFSDWLSKGAWLKRVRTLTDAGGLHLAYWPDLGPGENQPPLATIQSVRRAFADPSHSGR